MHNKYSICMTTFITKLLTSGGASALVSAWLVGPRLGRWELTEAPPMGSPTNALIGLYMLWWGWLAFNAGSTFGSVNYIWPESLLLFTV